MAIPRTHHRPCLLVLVLLAFQLHSTRAGANHQRPSHINPQQVSSIRGMFVFGSSLVDNGNNNFLGHNTTARADYPPYGIDSPLRRPSGRFSNGRNMIDALGELLQLRGPIPPFLHPRTKGRKVLGGVNFASGGSGILDQTGAIGGKVISLKEQVENFERKTLPELETVVAEAEEVKGFVPVHKRGHRRRMLGRYLFVVGTGGNDYLLNYYVQQRQRPLSPSDAPVPSLKDFTAHLITTLSTHLKRLHDLGARKFVVFSVPALGCTPVVKQSFASNPDNSSSCVEAINDAAMLFNTALRSLVERAPMTHLPGSRIVYVGSYEILRSIIQNPEQGGFTETNKACCELDQRTGSLLCRAGGSTCRDRGAHVFFDGLHPTEAVNVWIANRAFSSNLLDEAYPINVKQLARMKL